MINLISCASVGAFQRQPVQHLDEPVGRIEIDQLEKNKSTPEHERKHKFTLLPGKDDHQSSFNAIVVESKRYCLYAARRPTSNTNSNNINKNNYANQSKNEDKVLQVASYKLVHGNINNKKSKLAHHSTRSSYTVNSNVTKSNDSNDSSNDDHQSCDNVPSRVTLKLQSPSCSDTPRITKITAPSDYHCPEHTSSVSLIECRIFTEGSFDLNKPSTSDYSDETLTKEPIKNSINSTMTFKKNKEKENQLLVVAQNEDDEIRSSSSLLFLHLSNYSKSWLARLFQRHHGYASTATTKLDSCPSCLIQSNTTNWCDSDNDNDSLLQQSTYLDGNRTNQTRSKASAGGFSNFDQRLSLSDGAVVSGANDISCDHRHQHQSILNWTTVGDYTNNTNSSLRRPIAYTNIVHQNQHQHQHQQHQTTTRLAPYYLDNMCCCCQIQLNQPKDYKFYLLILLLMIGLFLVVMVAIGSIMIYLDNGINTRSSTLHSTLTPIAKANNNRTANANANRSGIGMASGSVMPHGKSSFRYNRFDERKNHHQHNDTQTNYDKENDNEKPQIRDIDCDECRHHAKCRRLLGPHPTVQCYCPSTCVELLNTSRISIYHEDNMNGSFGTNSTTILTPKSNNNSTTKQKQQQPITGHNIPYSLYNNDDHNVTTATLRDKKQSTTTTKQTKSSLATLLDEHSATSSSSSSNNNGAHIEYPLCGTDGNDYPTFCQLLNASCIHQMDVGIKSYGSCKTCAHMNCRHYSRCQMSDNRVPYCVCPRDCDSILLSLATTSPQQRTLPSKTDSNQNKSQLVVPSALINTTICASNLVTYANECQMLLDSCKLQESLKVAYMGQCDKCRNVKCERGRYCKEGRCICEDRCNQQVDLLSSKMASWSNNAHAVVYGDDTHRYTSGTSENDTINRLDIMAPSLTGGPKYESSANRQSSIPSSTTTTTVATTTTNLKQSICANDGNTYKNQCELLRHACLNSLDLRPLFYGSCDDQEDSVLRAAPIA